VLDLTDEKVKTGSDATKNSGEEAVQTAHGQVLSRNDYWK
jgi:hypothetical protein